MQQLILVNNSQKGLAMKKQDAIQIFGSAAELARATGKSRAAVSRLNDNLTQSKSDEVIGAAIRTGVKVPADILRRHRRGAE